MKEQDLKQLLKEMTPAEKMGQLVQLTPDFFSEGGEITGPVEEWHLDPTHLFEIGSVLGVTTAAQVEKIQREYLAKSRLKIPLVFMADVIHGSVTTFPIPLAMAAMFDATEIEEMARLSALEASKGGVQVTFSPMADYMKDSRWGRVMEGNGEDPTLSKVLTAAYVKGYQGSDLAHDKQHIASCVKHFVGYAAAQGGRDYNTVDFSDLELYQNYLPAFQAAIASGAEMVMTSFNTVRGIPSSGNKALLEDLLRQKLGFDKMVISDWGAVSELINHRVASDKYEAADLAFHAGVDMDMMGDAYFTELPQVIQTKADQERLDQAVWRVLSLKNKLGLFEDPYRGLQDPGFTDLNASREEVEAAALRIAQKSQVLLKNDGLLPLAKDETVALIGTKATSQDILGNWSWIGDPKEAISLAEGMAGKSAQVTCLPLTEGQNLTEDEIEAAVTLSKKVDKVVVAVGELSTEVGEATSMAHLKLKRKQAELIQALYQANPHLVVVLFNGRPLDLTNIVENCGALLEAWFPGKMGGVAIADILYGTATPQGKLPMSFPRAVGQLPYTYAGLSTGRPETKANKGGIYISNYHDEDNEALFAFGHGLTYGACDLALVSAADQMTNGALQFAVSVQNTGAYPMTETIQLYVQDEVAQVARPIKELKHWQKVSLAPGQSHEITFTVTEDDLAYYHSDLERSADTGYFKAFIGTSSEKLPLTQRFYFQK